MPDEIIADARAMPVEIRATLCRHIAGSTEGVIPIDLVDRVLAEAGNLRMRRRRSDGSFCPPRTE
jgi:hypothetical protein